MKYLVLLLTLSLIGCASVSLTPVSFNKEFIENPPLNKKISDELGNTLVEYSVLSYIDSIAINNEFKTEPNAFGVYWSFPRQTLKPVTIDENGKTYYQFETFSAFGGLSPNGPFPNISFYRGVYDGEKLCVQQIIGVCIPGANIIKKKFFDLSQPNLKQQLIYNGRVGDYVKFLYRELSEGKYLRPPFTQEIQYDLNEGKTIGFRGARLEIIEATNREITYIVRRHFNPSM